MVDGGAILAQARAELRADDTVATIDAQLSALGTELLIALLRRRRNGDPLRGVPQDLTRGIETRKGLWSRHLDRHVRALERGGLSAMIDGAGAPGPPHREARSRRRCLSSVHGERRWLDATAPTPRARPRAAGG